MRAIPLVLLLLLAACSTEPQPSDAEQLVARSIAFHDPDGAWYGRAHRIELKEKRPDGSTQRISSLHLDPLAGSFGMRQVRGEDVVEAFVDAENCATTVNGAIPDSSLAARYRLTCPDGPAWWREYYAFMHGLPMKLQDPGALIEPGVVDTTFMDRAVRQIRVTYSPEVGSDIWYFYFDPDTAQIVGSRFYHDEAAGDGEYIPFDGLVEADGMRLIREIHWYTNTGDRYLGTDSLAAYERG